MVAKGKLWTSRYLKLLPNRGWRKYQFAVCEHCQRYQRVLLDADQDLEACLACRRPLSGRNRGVFLVPEFGFITETKPPAKPGESRPERTFSTRTFFSGQAKEMDRIRLQFRSLALNAIPAAEGELAVINHAGYQGFKVCHACGYTLLGSEKVPSSHETPWRTRCEASLARYYLGHEFKTDILQIQLEGYANGEPGFWLSLLYALLEGASQALDIDRQDLDGCLYAYAGDPARPALVLFDEVPGGAGHVRRIAQSEERMLAVLQAARAKLELCDCGGEEGDASCYGCLRNYRNQFCHDELKRGWVIDFLRKTLGL